MISSRLPLFLVLLASIAQADGPKNLDFEDDDVDAAPTGWFLPTKGYKAAIMDKGAKEGEQFARLSGGKDADRGPFGNLMQSFDATPFRGNKVQLKAAVRTKVSGTNRAQMWIRVDRPNQQMGFFDNMGDRPITSGKWKYYEINGKVADDAVSISVGFMLLVEGSLDVDDVSFKVAADKAQASEGPAELSPRGVENLVAFTRLFGYVRYFHPSPESADADWNEIAVNGVPKVEKAKTAEGLAKALTEVFAPIAPSVLVYAGDQKPDLPEELKLPEKPSETRVTHWVHHGLGPNDPTVQSVYSSKIEKKRLRKGKIPEGFADPARPFVADLGGGVSCMVPLSLYVGNKRPNAKSGDEDKPAKHYSAEDRSVRLADVALIWNVYQHFYPYFDIAKVDWETALGEALKAAASDNDERAFLDTLRRLVAKTADGHGNVWHMSDANAPLPLLWTWVGEKLVVVKSDAEGADGPAPGDVVEQIDGKPVAELYAKAEKLISGATPAWRRWRGLTALGAGPSGSSVELSLRSPDGKQRKVKLARAFPKEPIAETRPEKIAEVKPGIFYIDIGRIDDDDFASALDDLEKAKGLVFDFRGYPGKLGFGWINRLIKESATSPQWHVPCVTKPDRVDFTCEQSPGWMLTPMPPYLKAKRAFLIDGRAISYAESCMGIIEHYKLGEIVGQPTAGTNGNVNPITLPGGYNVVWTGMKVLKHDGSQHHGVGIKPTVPVSPTIAGIAAGRDEILEKGIEVVSE